MSSFLTSFQDSLVTLYVENTDYDMFGEKHVYGLHKKADEAIRGNPGPMIFWLLEYKDSDWFNISEFQEIFSDSEKIKLLVREMMNADDAAQYVDLD